MLKVSCYSETYFIMRKPLVLRKYLIVNKLDYLFSFSLSSQTLDTHKKLSFSHIMKHWKKQTPAQAAANKSKQILLRYYPPSARQPSGRGGE